ncbi:MAG: NAD(P)H-dependent oxidoreductase [Acidimicrobiales bacterium]|nr:NAD(P)H-dependent oxidoreductase [Acidimicrobiales bacterium]MCB1016490.1 NAD(P)H-dependent oxidoreductase [Acidimicrobiales bacterium]
MSDESGVERTAAGPVVTLRLLTICGSLQARSANRAALVVIESASARIGATVEAFADLEGIPAFNADRAEPAPPAVAALRTQLAAADAVVIAAPEYAGGVAGAVKNATDWIVGTGELYAKPVAVVSCGTSGGEHACRQLVQSLTWQGAHVVADLGIAAPRTKSDDDGRFTDPATLAALEQVAAVVVAAPGLPADERRALVAGVIVTYGIDEGHLAPFT